MSTATGTKKGLLANWFSSDRWNSRITTANTVCRQGKVRPWLLLSIPLVVLSVVLLFWMPFSGPRAQAAWVGFSYVLYYCVSFTMWNMSKELTPALSSRNVSQRKNLAMAAEITRNVGTGFVSILFPMILSGVCVAMNGNDAQGYLLTMSLMACLAIPLTFVQYFYTRERVTEERRGQLGHDSSVEDFEKKHILVKPEATLREQLAVCLKDKYWLMFVLIVFAFNVLGNMRNISLIYYCGWVVRGNQWINFSYQGSYIVIGIIVFVLFKFFFDIEKRMPQVAHELQERRVAEYAAQGLEYIPADELERREIELQKAEAEADRIADLKALCEKKGLDFETENRKVLTKRAEKEARQAAKAAKAAAKAARKK